jgi:hypothetical protein
MKTRKKNYLIIIMTLLGLIILCTNCKKEQEPVPPVEIPTIVSVEPSEGTIGTELTITGSNFKAGAVVMIGDKISSLVEIGDGSKIYAIVPSGIIANTLLSLKVTNPTGGNASFLNAFKAVSPVLSFVNSATKPSGNIGSTVIFEGKAFGDLQGSGQILFSDGTATGTIAGTILTEDDWTETFIVTTVPNGAKDGPVIVKTEIGESNSMPFKVTDNATFSPSTITWTLSAALPAAVSGHNALSIPVDDPDGLTNQYAYVSGGRLAGGAASDQMVFGKLGNDGSISAWTNTITLPVALSFHNSVAAVPFNSKVSGSGFIYVIGGINGEGTVISTVSSAAINNDGTIKPSWRNETALPQPLYSAGAVIFRGSVYVAGGSTTGNVPVKTVYRSKINELGQLGAWESMPELPSAMTHHGFVQFGGYLYSIGGETGTVNPDDGTSGTAPTDNVLYSKINLRTGEIGSWIVNPSALGKARSKHTTLVLGGNIFVTSGLYSGLSAGVQGSSENVYSVINSDGSLGSFNGATGSNTLFKEGGNNLFNQNGISYIDADGVAHVMVIGGAKVGSPDIKIDKTLYY